MKERRNILELCRKYYIDGAKDAKVRQEAFNELCESCFNTIRHETNLVYDFYGKEEIKWSGIEYDDLISAGTCGLADGLEHFVFKEEEFCTPVFHNYMHLYIKGAIRKCIQDANGVSQYCTSFLIKMKMNGLSFDMTDEELAVALKQKLVTIQNLRHEFSAERKQPIEAATEIGTKNTAEDFTENMGYVELIKKTIPKEDLPFFYDRFMERKPLKLVDLEKKYKMTSYFVRRKEAEIRGKLKLALENAGASDKAAYIMNMDEPNKMPLQEIETLNIA